MKAHFQPTLSIIQNTKYLHPNDLEQDPSQQTDERPDHFEEDSQWLEEVTGCIRENLSNNRYSIGQLAGDVAISERQLRRRIKKLLGLRPREYMMQIRLQHAHYLIHQKKYRTLAQVAQAVGYRDSGAFRDSFQQWYGSSPTELLRN